MYYAKELFVKRGPLATLWLAGSLLRKVTKTQILQADVQKMWSEEKTGDGGADATTQVVGDVCACLLLMRTHASRSLVCPLLLRCAATW